MGEAKGIGSWHLAITDDFGPTLYFVFNSTKEVWSSDVSEALVFTNAEKDAFEGPEGAVWIPLG